MNFHLDEREKCDFALLFGPTSAQLILLYQIL